MRRQRLATRVTVNVSCISEPCRATVTGSVRVPRIGRGKARTYALTAATRVIPAGASVIARPALSSRARSAIRRALRAHRSITVVIGVHVADLAGNAVTLTRRAGLRL